MLHFSSMCEFPDKDIKFPKWSCVLNFCSECPGVFFPEAEINYEEDVNLPSIHFHHYKDISSCYLTEHILPDNGKTCPLCTNLEDFDKGKVTT